MDTIIPLLFGLLSILGFLMTTALVYLIVKPAPGNQVSGKKSRFPERKLHAP
jgi:hypothetical protein